MTRTLSIGIIQTAYGEDMNANIDKTEHFIREAAGKGAQVVLPSELFQGHYFCTTQDERWFATAYPAATHPCVVKLQPVAKALNVAIPVSIFEKEGPHYYNAIVMLDADGEIMGTYRKSHIPDGPGYCEKYYFRPGNTGYKVWATKFGKIGVGICWDQWFPECARAMALQGAEVLLYPTAIGNEPQDASLDTMESWRLAQRGHAVSNAIIVAASNRIGVENGLGAPAHFYGSSFIADQRGHLVQDMNRTEEGTRVQRFNMDEFEQYRAAWGFFRDRREELQPASFAKSA